MSFLQDNKDGTVNVSYLPTAPGEYKISAKFADKHIEGSPFTCKITGEGKKRNAISVGSSSDLSLPDNLSSYDLRSLNAFIVAPSGAQEPCFLKKLPKGNTGISFTPKEVGEHQVSVTREGAHIRNSPFKIKVSPGDVGDASKVRCSGRGLREGRTHEDNLFHVDTRQAGYGGLSLSVEGPSKAEIKCKDHEDGTLDVSYRYYLLLQTHTNTQEKKSDKRRLGDTKMFFFFNSRPTEPGLYIVNLKFADHHVPGSPFAVAVSGLVSGSLEEEREKEREALISTNILLFSVCFFFLGFQERAGEDQCDAGGCPGHRGRQPMQTHLQDARDQRIGPGSLRLLSLRKGQQVLKKKKIEAFYLQHLIWRIFTQIS